MTARGQAFGKEGEERAARFLESQGCVLLERGFRSSFGELDLVVRDGDTIVFVEVKARASKRFGEAQEAVTPVKQAHMAKAALAYLSARGLSDRSIRFDVVAVQGEGLRHFKDAFSVEGFTR